MSTYRHRQIAWPTVVGFVATLATQGGAIARNVRRGRRLRALASLPWALSLVVSMGMFSWLDTEVTGEEFVASFVAGALRRRTPLNEIESAEVVTVPWYYGWGPG
jgi:ABC-type sugar transport system permease subunit